MSSINYMKDETVRNYYEKWALNPTLLGWDRENFNKFVKACFRVDKQLDIDYLRLALYDSFHDQYDEGDYVKFTGDVVVLFEQLRDYENTTLP